MRKHPISKNMLKCRIMILLKWTTASSFVLKTGITYSCYCPSFPNDGEKSLLKAEIPEIATSKHLSPIRKKIDCNMNRLSYGWSKLCAVRVHFPMIVQNVKDTVKVVFLQLFLM